MIRTLSVKTPTKKQGELNPAAYRECVEALKYSLKVHSDLMKAYDKETVEHLEAKEAARRLRQALAHTEETREERPRCPS